MTQAQAQAPQANDRQVEIARKSAVWHKVERGILFDAFYDTETTDLDKRYAEITQFGGLITDLAGNILHTVDYRGKVSDYTVMSPYAAIIQRMQEGGYDKGDPQYWLAGRVMQFFRHSNSLYEAPFKDEFLKICRPGRFRGTNGVEGDYYAYPLQNDDGTIDWNSVQIHSSLKYYEYFNPETNEYLKRDIGAQAIGYNNVNADDQWIWTMMHMAGAHNIFITHLAKAGMSRLDALKLVESVYVAGPKGEKGIKPAFITDAKTGIKYPSFSMGDVLKANTHIASELRNLAEGITLSDGSYVDVEQLHGALKDSLALLGMMKYLRRQVPELVVQMEKNGNWKYVSEMLHEKSGNFGNHPVMAYVKKAWPYVTGQMISLIGTDQYRHNPKVGLAVNLGINPEEFHFNGKPIKELTPEEWSNVIKLSKNDQSGLFVMIRMHQSPRVFDSSVGFKANFNNGLEMRELQRRAKIWRDETLISNILKGLRLAEPKLSGPERLMLPQPEEHLFTFSTLELFDPETGEDVQVNLIQSRLEKIVSDSRHHVMTAKELWLQAIEPDEDIFLNSFSAYQDETNAAGNFMGKIKRINKRLEANKAELLPPPDDDTVHDYKTALKYKIKLMFFARNHFAAGNLIDIGHHFWFEDQYGHKIPEEEIRKWPDWRLEQAHNDGSLNVRHEILNVTGPIIDRILDTIGYGDILGEEIKEQLNAVKALRIHGIPSLNGNDRWYTIEQAHRDIIKIAQNELMDEDIKAIEKRTPGAWESFLLKHNDAQTALGAYVNYLKNVKKKSQDFTSARKLSVCIDPSSGAPIENYEYAVDHAKAIKISIPERYIDNPPCDPASGKPVWLFNLKDIFNAQSRKGLDFGKKDVILVSSGTKKQIHLVKPVEISIPPQGGLNEEFYKNAKARYTESGLHLKIGKDTLALIGEGPYEIHGTRIPEFHHQAIKIPKHHFEGLMDEKLASYKKKPSGVIIRDDALVLSEGPVRLLEEDEESGNPSGWEVGTSIKSVKRMSLSDIKSMTDDDALRYGYSNADAMIAAVSEIFSSKKQKLNDRKNTVLVIDFEKIEPLSQDKGTLFFKPSAQKISVADGYFPS